MIFSPLIKQKLLEVLPTELDKGTGGKLFIYRGDMPDNFNRVSTGLIVSLPFQTPSIKSVSDTLLELTPPEGGSALITAEAGWARLVGHDNRVLANLTLGVYGGNEDVIIHSDTRQIYQGGKVVIESISFSFE